MGICPISLDDGEIGKSARKFRRPYVAGAMVHVNERRGKSHILCYSWCRKRHEGKVNIKEKQSNCRKFGCVLYLGTVDLGLDKVIAVDGGGDGDAGQAGADELKHGHLLGRAGRGGDGRGERR